jgi:hypothetical protein
MTTDFDSELDALLDAHDEKQKADDQAQAKSEREAVEFGNSCTGVVRDVIRPTLEKVREKLTKRGKPCTLGLYNDDGEGCDSIAIYFDRTASMPSWHWSGQVIFSCNNQEKILEVHGKINDQAESKPSRSAKDRKPRRLRLADVTEETVQSEVMLVLREISGKT